LGIVAPTAASQEDGGKDERSLYKRDPRVVPVEGIPARDRPLLALHRAIAAAVVDVFEPTNTKETAVTTQTRYLLAGLAAALTVIALAVRPALVMAVTGITASGLD
jgi:hypothetical protein